MAHYLLTAHPRFNNRAQWIFLRLKELEQYVP